MNKIVIIAVVAVIITSSGAFYSGMKYAQGRGMNRNAFGQGFANISPEQRQQLGGAMGGGARNGQRGSTMGGGLVAGEIISKDDTSITVKIPDGGSKIVFFSEETEVGKSTTGTSEDLKVGETVTTNGTPNSDGSITASTIQIRPIPTVR